MCRRVVYECPNCGDEWYANKKRRHQRQHNKGCTYFRIRNSMDDTGQRNRVGGISGKSPEYDFDDSLSSMGLPYDATRSTPPARGAPIDIQDGPSSSSEAQEDPVSNSSAQNWEHGRVEILKTTHLPFSYVVQPIRDEVLLANDRQL